uniref:Uncharacterized protein n=1 Tax=Trichinella nativa TaxID=6335 RepID=A0A0V1KHZ4_9BILA
MPPLLLAPGIPLLQGYGAFSSQTRTPGDALTDSMIVCQRGPTALY